MSSNLADVLAGLFILHKLNLTHTAVSSNWAFLLREIMRDKLQIVYVASFHLTFTNRQLWYGRASVSYTSLKDGSTI